MTLVYAGNMGAGYDLATAIDAVKATSEWTFLLAGTGPNEAALRQRAADCRRIRFLGYLPADELAATLRTADCALVPLVPESCVGVPGKLADYLSAGLPVIECLGGETRALLEKFHAGCSYSAGNMVELAALLKDYQALAALRPGAAALREAFDADKIYAEYVHFIEETLK